MKFSLNNPRAIYKTFRSVDLILVIISIGTSAISGTYNMPNLPIWHLNGFLALFTLIAFWNPYDKSLRHKRIYIAVNLLLIVLATLLLVTPDLQFYWIIIKACFLLPLPDVVFGLTIVGVLQMVTLYFRYPYLVELSRSNGVEISSDPKNVILGSLSYYLGSSIFCVILSSILLSERESRMRAENLSREVETLAANIERSRIAREIHDSMGHLLTTLDIQLEVAQKQYDRDPDQTRRAIDSAKELSTQCLQEVRYAVQSIRDSEFNLNQSILTLLDRMPSTWKIQADCRFPPLPLQMSHQIYCITQEALTNAQKHAQATEVKISGYGDDQTIVLRMTDNGIGFDLGSPRSGFGLRGMEERVQLMGGKLTMESSLVSGEGTRIHICIPRNAMHHD
jgi:signal transduction histidine kinase